MTAEQAKTIASLFLNWSEDEMNIVDWSFVNNELKLKIEDLDDGMIEVYTIALKADGYALSQDLGNFRTVNVEESLNNIHELAPVCDLPSPTEHSVSCIEATTAFQRPI